MTKAKTPTAPETPPTPPTEAEIAAAAEKAAADEKAAAEAKAAEDEKAAAAAEAAASAVPSTEAPGKLPRVRVVSNGNDMLHLHQNKWVTKEPRSLDLDAFTQAQIETGKWSISEE